MTFTVGELIGNYRIIKKLGNGAFGDVYQVNHILLDTERAVKFILAKQGQDLIRLLDEARNSYAAAEDHIIRVYNADLVANNGNHYVAIEMEYLPDGSIYDIARQNYLSFQEALRATRHVLYALSAAHGAGIIHRDVKPANILKAGNNYKLADFGLSYLKGSAGGYNNLVYVMHAAPELYNRVAPSETTDIYATGMTLYRLCLPFSAINLNMSTLTNWRSGKMDKTFPDHNGIPSYLPNKLRAVIRKATAVDPANRYATAAEMMAAVERLSIKLNWKRSSSGAVWEANNDSKNHIVKLIAKNGTAVCQYKVNGRKPRSWENVEEQPKAALKRLNSLIKSTLLN